MSKAEQPIRRTIVDHYNTYDESQRLRGDIGPLELARTRELMQRFLSPPPAAVIDVGGATGVYSFWLAGLGYEVHLVDIVPRHIEQARQISQESGIPQLASMEVGDARELELEDGVADALIMHGPLYHLVDRDDRLKAIREAGRVLRPGGVLLAFAITRYAGLIYGLLRGHVFAPEYLRMVDEEVRSGQRRDPPEWSNTFPSAYFHLPEELGEEIRGGGLDYEGTLGILGPAWMVPDLDGSWGDETQREVILDIARLTENEPVLGPRLLGVGRKPA